jgi:hypothetical protein
VHQFPRSAVQSGTGWVPPRARCARQQPGKASLAQAGSASDPDPGGPACPRLLASRTAEDPAANLRRIDGARSGIPHDRAGAAAAPPGIRPIRRAHPSSAAAWPSAVGRPRRAAISIHLAWRNRPARPDRSPGFLPAAAVGDSAMSPQASRGDLRSTGARARAAAPALFRYHPAACFAYSPAPPHHASARHWRWPGSAPGTTPHP